MSDAVASEVRTPTPQFKDALEQAQQALEQAGFKAEVSPWSIAVFRTGDSRRLASVMPRTLGFQNGHLDGDVIDWLSAPYESTRIQWREVLNYRAHCELSDLVVAVRRHSAARELAEQSRQRAAESTFEVCLRRFLFQGELQHAPGQPWDVEDTLRKGKSGVTKDLTLSRIQKRLERAYPCEVLSEAIKARKAGGRLPALFVFAMALRFGNNRTWAGNQLHEVALDEADISDFLRFRRALGGYGRRVRDAVAFCRRRWCDDRSVR